MSNNKKLLKLILSTFLILLSMILFRSFYFYQDMKDEVILDAKKEANLLRDYLMSMREVYQKQFLQSGIELNDETLGFLPAHASTIISQQFQQRNKDGFYIKNVSNNPRNPINKADIYEQQAIDYFNENNQKKEYFKEYTNTKGNQYFQYAEPIYIEQYCLNCHGHKASTLQTIQNMYDSAYDYKVGDLRGIVSIKIPIENITTRLFIYLQKELIIAVITIAIILLLLAFVYRKVIFNIKEVENTAMSFASKDTLTELYNRRHLEKIQNDFNNTSYIIAFLDIDHFKTINDTYGHDMGDTVLKEFAKILQQQTRENDIICRYGGEEFLIIIKNISLEQAIEKLDSIRRKVEQTPIELKNNIINITISIGVDISLEDQDLNQTITNADAALYKAKNNGRNRLEYFQKGDE